MSSEELKLDLAPDAYKEDLALKFSQGASVEGRVTNGEGLPIAQATISIFATQTREARAVAADFDGSFEISGLSPDRYRLVASAPNSGLSQSTNPPPESTKQVELAANGRTEVSFALSLKQGSLRGKVYEAQGEPLANCIVVLHGNDGRVERRTVSDNQGVFIFEALWEGPHSVTAYVDGVGQATADAVNLDQELQLRVESYGRVCGQVQWETPIFRVRLSSNDSKTLTYEEEFSGTQQRWCISQVKTGAYKATLFAAGKTNTVQTSVLRDSLSEISFESE